MPAASDDVERPIGHGVEAIAVLALGHHDLPGIDRDLGRRPGRRPRARAAGAARTQGFARSRLMATTGMSALSSATRSDRHVSTSRSAKNTPRPIKAVSTPPAAISSWVTSEPATIPMPVEQLDGAEDAAERVGWRRSLQQHSAGEVEQRSAEPDDRQQDQGASPASGRLPGRAQAIAIAASRADQQRRQTVAPYQRVVDTSALISAPTPTLVCQQPRARCLRGRARRWPSTTTIRSIEPTST